MKIEIHDVNSDDEKGAFDYLEIRDKDMEKAQLPQDPSKKEDLVRNSPNSNIGPPEKVAS